MIALEFVQDCKLPANRNRFWYFKFWFK